MFGQLFGVKVFPCNPELLFLGVTRQFQDFHPVPKRARDLVREVRGRYEQHLREIEGHAEVVIHEGVVLSRVQHLHQRRRWISLERDTELVHLVEQKHGVLAARALQPFEDPSR